MSCPTTRAERRYSPMARYRFALPSPIGLTMLLLPLLAATACSSSSTAAHSDQLMTPTTAGPAHGTISILPKQISGGLHEILVGPDGNLWSPATFEFERMSPSGTLTGLPLKTLARRPLNLI